MKKDTKTYKENEKINLPVDLNIVNGSFLKRILYNPYTVKIIGGLIVGVIILTLTIYFSKKEASQSFPDSSIVMATNTIDVSEIFNRISTMGTSLEKQNFLENYKNSEIEGAGSYTDISRPADNYLVNIDVSGGKIACSFSADYDKKLLLLEKGQKLSFSGIFTGSVIFGSNRWHINDCILK